MPTGFNTTPKSSLATKPRDSIFENNQFARYYSIYMTSVVAVTASSWIWVSVGEVFSSGSAEGVNLISIAIYMCISVSYLVYGFIKKDQVLVLGAILGITANLILLLATFIVTH